MTDSARVLELKKALTQRHAALEEGLKMIEVKVDGENTYVDADKAAIVTKAAQDVKEIKALIEAELLGGEMKQWLEEGTKDSVAMASTAAEVTGGYSVKDLGTMFTDSDEFKDFRKQGGYTMRQAFELKQKDIVRLGAEVKDVYGSLATHTIDRNFGRIQFDPTVPRQQRTNRVRDLFPVATTNANLIDFFRVTGFTEQDGEGNASPVPDRDGSEFGLKPHSNLEFESDQAPVRTIAHYEAAHRNVLSDEPQLQATINNELLYGLALEEDYQILRGAGTGEDLRGILNTPDVQTYTPGGSELKSDSLRKAATKAIIANYAPTGYVLHPNDWEDVELQKGTTNDHYMLFTNVAVGLSAQVWRQPVVETVAMPEGTFLTGAFGIGAQLYDRMQANIRIAEQHADFFIRNAVVILAEQRLALAVKRPESFVIGEYNP